MRNFKYSIIASILLSVALVACGGDNGTSANDDVEKSSSSVTQSSSSVIQSGDSHEGSSNSKRSSSSSSKVSSSSAKATSSSSSAKSVSSSSKRSEGDPSSSSQKIASSSSSPRNDVSSSSAKVASSSSVAPASSSSKKVVSSSSEYVPYNHEKCLAGNWNISTDDYKTFTDPRNGRSYYYYTAVSSKTGKNVTVMAENLNIGDMVLGEKDQNDDSNIERYCYNNDTTYCDQFGGLYQWAEMMQLPSRCNTESCSDLIQENHRGICPEGWRLFTWDDYVIIRQYNDEFDHGIEGLRSQCFNGYNTSGFSIIGAGIRTANGKFESLSELAAWFRPEEYESDAAIRAHHGMMSSLNSANPSQTHRELKVKGFSVRCVKLE